MNLRIQSAENKNLSKIKQHYLTNPIPNALPSIFTTASADEEVMDASPIRYRLTLPIEALSIDSYS